MKKLLTTTLFLLLSIAITAQNFSEEDKVKNVVETFFKGFHARDSVIMKSVFHEDPVVQTIGSTKEGETKLVKEGLEKLLTGIVSIPLQRNFEEVLHD